MSSRARSVLAVAVVGLVCPGGWSTAASADSLNWKLSHVDATVGGLTNVACPSEDLCVAVDFAGNVVTSSNPAGGGSTWSSPFDVSPQTLYGVSCAAASPMCVAVGNCGVAVWSTNPTGGSSAWEDPEQIAGCSGGERIAEVACPSPTRCVAVDTLGEVVWSTDPTGGHTAWSLPVTLAGALRAVSCPSVTLCVAVSVTQAFNSTDGGASWSSAVAIDTPPVTNPPFNDVSCPSTTLCVAVTPRGNVVHTSSPTGGASGWTAVNIDNRALTGISCPSASVCVATDEYGRIWESHDPIGGSGAWKLEREPGSLQDLRVECPSTRLCVGVNTLGDVLTGHLRTSQSITFSAPANGTVGDSALLTATASSGLPVTVVVDSASSPAGVCSIDGDTVSYHRAGTCLLDADQSGDDDHEPASRVQQTIHIAKAAQTITFTPPARGTVDGSAVLTATASSGLPVTFSVDSAGVCRIDDDTVTYMHAGDCVIDADQAGDDDQLAAPQVQRTVHVAKATQSITFTAPASGAVGDSAPLTATASSGLPVTLSVDSDSDPHDACAIDADTVSYAHAGSCVVDADQPGDDDHLAAAQVQHTLHIDRAAQSITFTAPADSAVGGTAVLTATASSGLPVTFSVDSAGICRIDDDTVTYMHAGSCVIDADQPGDDDHQAAAQVQRTIHVAKATQSITFTAPGDGNVGDVAVLTATASSRLPVTLSVDSATSPHGACTIDGNSVSYVHAGSCAIDADQPGDDDHQPAAQVQRTMHIAKAGQSITFSAPEDGAIGDAAALTATASSGLPVTLSVDAATSPHGACSINGGTVSYEHAGSCAIDADQPGDADHLAAPRVQHTIHIGRTAQSITFTAPESGTVGDTAALTAIASSGLPVTLDSAGSPAGACSIDSDTVSYLHAGSCAIDANQAGDDDHAPAERVQHTIHIAKAGQSITLSAPDSGTIGDAAVLAATASSGLPVTLSVDSASSPHEVCSIDAKTVSYQHAGSCVIDADQTGDDDHLAAPRVQHTIHIGRTAQSITFTAPGDGNVGDAAALTATASSGLPVTLSVDSATSPHGACTIDGNSVSYAHAGSCAIDADQPGDDDHAPAPRVQHTITVVVTAASVIRLPSARKCVSRRHFVIHLRRPGGVKLASATVKLNGHRVKVRKGKRLHSTIDLRGLPRGRFTVSITVVTADGRRLTGKRRYRTCTAARPKHKPPKV